jgi:hypothetical protein
LAAGGLEIRQVSGYHSTIAVEPRVQELAEEVRFCLDEARRRGHGAG